MPASSGSGTSNTTTVTASESAVPECKVPELRFCEVPGLVYSAEALVGVRPFSGACCSAVRVRFSGLAVRRCVSVFRDLLCGGARLFGGTWLFGGGVGRSLPLAGGRPERALRLLTRCRGRGMRRAGPRERCRGVAMRRQPLLRSRSIAASEGMPTAARSRMWVFALRIAEVSGSPGSIR